MTGKDTIFALATAPGKAGVAIVRISGPASLSALSTFGVAPPPVRYMALRRLEREGDLIDTALVVRFAGGASFTGEEMVELHLHGGRAVVARVLEDLGVLSGFRSAEPGEFTRRALDAGRMDLTEVEGLADLIDAETEAQRRLAVQLADGALSATIAEVRKGAVHALALTEAAIDFADEDDAPEDVSDEVGIVLTSVDAALRRLVDGARRGEKVREGFRVALVGAPNVGKSTLLNAISGREAAITSPHAGTTRDAIEVACDIGGLPVVFVDLAGLREASDEVEAEGVRRARRIAEEADLRLFLVGPELEEVDDGVECREGDIVVRTKADIPLPRDLELTSDFHISARDYVGVGDLLAEIGRRLEGRVIGFAAASRSRHSERLAKALEKIGEARSAEEGEVRSLVIREAVRYLDEIVGIVDVEDVLGEIFSRFCMGK